MSIVRIVARPMLASLFVVQGYKAARNPEPLAPRAARVTEKIAPSIERLSPSLPTSPEALARVNGAAQVLAGLALATGRAPRLSALVLLGSVVPTTLAGHAFWDEEDADARAAARLQFLKNTSVTGGLLLAAVDLDGRPGLRWRSKDAGRRARRVGRRSSSDARRIARTARREAGLAGRLTKAQTKALLP